MLERSSTTCSMPARVRKEADREASLAGADDEGVVDVPRQRVPSGSPPSRYSPELNLMKSSGGGSTPACESMWWVWPRWWIWCWKRLVRQRRSGRLKYSPVSTVSKERIPSSSAGSRASQNPTYHSSWATWASRRGVEVLVEDLVEAGEGGGLLLQALAVDEVGEEDVVQGAVDGAEEPAAVADALLVGEPGARRVEPPVGPRVVPGGGGEIDQHRGSSVSAKSPHRTTSNSDPTGSDPSTYIGANISVISRMSSLATNRR